MAEEPEDAELLASPPWPVMEVYYDQLRASGLIVKQTQAMGKGVFADTGFQVDEVVLREPPLVGVQHSHNKDDAIVCSFCFRYIGSIRLQIKNKLQGGEYPCCEKDQKVSCVEAIELLSKEDFSLPYEEQFELPAIVECPGGCSELFCSDSCAEAAWEAHHSLLCVGVSQKKDALTRFKQFADETNDVFHVASQVIANVMLRGKRLLKERGVDTGCRDMSVLLEAWQPFAMAHKRLWWEAMALPEDVDPTEEDSFRSQIKELAASSLCLLRAALYEEEYGPLFSLKVFGSIIGMFELNNLEIVVSSPVEDYFCYIDDLEHELKQAAEEVTRPLLDALGDRYTSFCQGTGFYALQSCVNHSCEPNAKAFKRDEDKDGHAVLLATRTIVAGEQILISYIDEDASYWERHSMLADYGFQCHCSKCSEEI